MNNIVIGADISFWQDDPTTPQFIDFKKMADNLDFVIIRAGQNLWSDKAFSRSWRESKEAGIPRGSYWFYDSRADPKRQAEKYIETLGGDFGELPLVADFEDNYGGSFGTIWHLYDFLERLKQLAPQKSIMIYTGYYYWNEKISSVSPSEKARLRYFAQYDLWLAWYGISESEIICPQPWRSSGGWTLWQYTSSGDGKKYGVESREIDLNFFNGSPEQFREHFGLEKPTPIPSSKIIQSVKMVLK